MRDKIINFLNTYLSINEYDDYTINGLQIEGKKEAKKVLFALTYSYDVSQHAIKNNFDMIIVHHGILFGETRPITGLFKKRIEPLIKNDINLACYHIPLDAHPKIGNNISIIKILSCNFTKPFGKHKNKYIGFIGEYKKPRTLNEIEKIIKTKINKNSLILKFGKEKIKTVAVISGSASSYFQDAILQGIDLFITGEPKEEIYYLAKDSQTNFIAAGHTHTEIFGIKNLQNLIKSKFKIYTEFLNPKNPI